ncbi:phage tail protein [Desulfuribacillus alkaliarsenatis]|uniref:Phage tail protein n=1 Tax=Desulfuribacillus alkaliarsenatis TaxID=766136 RepID=A0A1E5G2B1_9FIRM|nr:phage tail protein [Desulfuribacillus alkaliarsenatis]OEF97120.1 hypothetical protein BHF68_05860 [Desulfuribacillus alkaliarsenatis]
MLQRKSFVLKINRHFSKTTYNGSKTGVLKEAFQSYALDSMADDTVWHRCKLNANIPKDTNVYIAYYASNSKEFTESWQEIINNGTDFLLHKAKGRYLWLKIEYIGYGQEVPQIQDVQIDFPIEPLTWHLPEIYQQEPAATDLLNRYLGIFQSLMSDLDQDLEEYSRYLDIDKADNEFLPWLCRWLAISDHYLWPQEKLRMFMKNAYALYQVKGTKQAIEKVTEIYTDERPWIIEQYELTNENSREKDRLYSKLYGDNCYTFTVMVKEHAVPTQQHYLELKRIIESFTPAHGILQLVVLKSYLFLDSYTYLGVNSILTGSNSLILDGKSSIPFANMTDEWRSTE